MLSTQTVLSSQQQLIILNSCIHYYQDNTNIQFLYQSKVDFNKQLLLRQYINDMSNLSNFKAIYDYHRNPDNVVKDAQKIFLLLISSNINFFSAIKIFNNTVPLFELKNTNESVKKIAVHIEIDSFRYHEMKIIQKMNDERNRSYGIIVGGVCISLVLLLAIFK